MKSKIIGQLGETDILLPSLINEGLAANDRAKARLSVLQAAGRHGRNPSGAPFDLRDECRAAGIDPLPMQTLVDHASLADGERITAPGLGNLQNAIWDDVAAMIRAVRAGGAVEGNAFLARFSALGAAGTQALPDSIALSQIATLTAISDRRGDTLHRLVMDLHKALNRLAASHAEEVLAGAHVYGLAPEDRPAVEAFMRGVEATRRLKFDHPGLDTTAVRSGARLMIQNDIGETEAHVAVIAVDQNATTITYTDVHLERAKFFSGLLQNFRVQWSGLDRKAADGLGKEESFYLITGRYPVESAESRDAFLEAAGASLVFLIDWNKARKALQRAIPKADAISVLDWAARHRVGHRGFLELGGSELIASAVRHAAPARIGFGERLDRALGREAAVDFLKTVLRVSAESLLEGSSVRLARDRIEADLIRHLESLGGKLLAIVVRQAGLAREIAAGIVKAVAEEQAHRPFARASLASRARGIEEKADRIAVEARAEIARLGASPTIERLVNQIEEVIDELEQAAFIASLLPAELPSHVLKQLAELCTTAVRGAEAAAAGAAAAVDVPEGQRVDSEDALRAVGRLFEAEHDADDSERMVTAIVLRGELGLQAALSVLELARALERAADRLAGFGHLLRDHVLADLSA